MSIIRSRGLFKSHRLLFETSLVISVMAIAAGLGALSLPQAILHSTDSVAAVVASTIADLTNLDRGSNGVGRLTVSNTLTRAAQAKADDMASKGYFAHVSPDGTTPWHWFASAGYEFASAGENLAIDYFDSADVERAWMNSPFHRANIMNSEFTEVGIATATGTFEGHPTTFVVQLFGTPTHSYLSSHNYLRIVASTTSFIAATR